MLTVQGTRAYRRTHPVEALAFHVIEAVRDDHRCAQDLAMRQRLRCFEMKQTSVSGICEIPRKRMAISETPQSMAFVSP